MEAALKQEPNLTVELIQGDRGVFDVRAGDTLIFSKKTEGRFPTIRDILDRARARNS